MILVLNLAAVPNQQQTFILPDGSSFTFSMLLRDQQQGWFLTSLTYGPSNFALNSYRIVNSPNMLYQWQNILPFGLACYSTANREPSLLQDFSSGNSKLYVLTQAECQQFNTYVETGTFT